MKYIKTLGLAAVAATALIAFATSGASATVLCKETHTPCQGQDLVFGDPFDASLKSGTSSITEPPSGAALTTCTGSTISGIVEYTGGAEEPVLINVPKGGFTFTNCNATVHTLEGGTLEIAHIKGSDHGTVTATRFRVEKTILGMKCVYGYNEGHHIGTFTGGHPAQLDIDARETRISGGLLCPSELRWTATYVITSHTKLYVEPE